jgi:DNA-binding NtrC family response regulator
MPDRVLLVEGDELLGILFELALVDAGYAVTRVSNGREALSKLAEGAPPVDAVITDVTFKSGPDGWQVARRARARCEGLPVIYMTGGRGDEWAPQHVPMGVLLLKPFQVSQMVEMVGHMIAANREGRRRFA